MTPNDSLQDNTEFPEDPDEINDDFESAGGDE